MGGDAGVLSALNVLEIAEGVAGPVCGMQLADLGANVIKVEPPGGDRARAWSEAGEADRSVFAHLNRGKKSLVLNLAGEEDRAALFRLVDGADVVLVHMDPDDRSACGIDWRAARRTRPGLIVCEITDLGDVGDLRDRAGSELVVQAMAGFHRYVGGRDEPFRVGYEAACVGAGMHAVQAVLAMMFARDGTGEGDYCHISLLGSLLSLKNILLAAQGDPDEWAGFHLLGPHWPPDIGWETRDGQVTFDFRHNQRDAWAAFCRRVGLEHIVDDDPAYEAWRSSIYIGDRKQDLGEVYRPAFRAMSSAEASDLVNGLGGISLKFQDYGELLAHPQLQHLQPLVEVEDTGPQVGTPFRFADAELADPRPAAPPGLGALGPAEGVAWPGRGGGSGDE